MPQGRGEVKPWVETTVVAATPQGVNLAIEAFGRFGDAGRIPAEVRRKCQLALDEVLANVVRHGVAGRGGQIRLEFRRTGTEVTVQVEDAAPAFNPLTLPEPDTTAQLEHRAPGGLGVALIRELMDDVRYERRRNRNCLTMTSRLPGDAESSGGHA